MAEVDLTAIVASSIATPAAGVGAVFFDATGKLLKAKDDAGYVSGQTFNFSTASQAPAAATRTYLTGSQLRVPKNKLQIGTLLCWRFNVTKTAAGVAASTYDIAVGVAGTVADTARVSFTKPAGTAVIDEAWIEIQCTVRGPLSAVGVLVGTFRLMHNLSATGHAVIPCVVVTTISAGFDITVADLFVGVCVTSGAADALTIQQMQAQAINL